MAREDVQINVRLPAALLAHLRKQATQNGRSLTAEVLLRLQRSFEGARDSRIELRNIVERLDQQQRDLEGVRLGIEHEVWLQKNRPKK